MIRVALHGGGRMGHSLLRQLAGRPEFELAGVVARTKPSDLPAVDYFPDLDALEGPIDLLIDFTLPTGTAIAARWCEKNAVPLLSGTTGLSEEDTSALKLTATRIPLLWASNLSQGIALLTALASQVATTQGTQAKVKIHDVHHQHKVDAPSGTALSIASKLKADGPENMQINLSSQREGEVIGEHTITFSLPGEELEITHRALDRDIFAQGALNAGAWLVKQPVGYYSVRDWLGLA